MATVRQTNKILKIYKRKGLHIPYCIPLSWNQETATAFIQRNEQYLESTDSSFATQKQIIKRINKNNTTNI